MTLNYILEALWYVATPELLVIVALCTIIGIILGATPGIGPTLTLALAFPFVFGIDPRTGLLIMAVLYGSSIYGGSISAILVNVPGTPGSAATLLDGYPMTKNGESSRAIGLATTSSFIGGMIGLLLLALLGSQLARLALHLGSAEFFMMAVLGLSVVALVSRGSFLKSIASVSIGVILASVGQDPMTGDNRFAYDITYLAGGFDVITVVIGLFAIAQVIELAVEKVQAEETQTVGGMTWDGVKESLSYKIINIRSALVGIGIGSIPGVGATSSNFLAYLLTTQSSKNSEEFGTGRGEGVASAEAANNASAMGSLIPTMAFGIPGSAATAVFLGYMSTAGIVPGPEVFESSLPYVVFVGILLGNIAFLLIGLYASNHMAKVTTFSNETVLIGITVISFAGAFSIRNNLLDVGVVVLIGLLGFVMRQRGYSLVALILAYILVPIAERGFRRALTISGGDYTVFVTRPISLSLLIISLLIISLPLLKSLYSQLK